MANFFDRFDVVSNAPPNEQAATATSGLRRGAPADPSRLDAGEAMGLGGLGGIGVHLDDDGGAAAVLAAVGRVGASKQELDQRVRDAGQLLAHVLATTPREDLLQIMRPAPAGEQSGETSQR